MKDLMTRYRNELRYEPIAQRVRATLAGDTVVDSTRAILVWEPRRVVPTYAVPAEDVGAALAPAAAEHDDAPGVLHPGIPFAVHSVDGEPLAVADLDGAGFRFADEDLAGYVELDFRAFDEWFEEDEPVVGHPRDPFHRVDVRRTSRPVRVEIEGDVVAETTGARLVYETSLPTRFYLPREDVTRDLLPSERTSYCPYKGGASYWSLDAAGRLRQDIAWSYERPLPEQGALTGLVAFWDERVDVYLDGELHGRPAGAIATALRNEFRV
jgi:uncharacterized protein (DUF427 family)